MPRQVAEGPNAFAADSGGWKDVNFTPQKTADLKPGAFRLPRLTDVLGSLPPASRWHKLTRGLLRKKPAYADLMHEDYVEACRSLGVPTDIEEGKLQAKVDALMVKYEKDRKKKIMIDWSHDKILEHRLFLQLDGQAEKPPGGVDARMLDERFLELSQKDMLDLMTSLDLQPADLKGKPNPLAVVVNNPLTRVLKLNRLIALVRFVWQAFGESLEAPNLRRMLWPGSVGLVLALWFGNAVDFVPLKYFITVVSHTGPIYNRGEAKLSNRRERRPIKWTKLLLALTFMGMSTGAAWATGKAWIALKYPTFDLPAPLFLPALANFVTYVMSSCFFIRESTLAGGREGRDTTRRPA